MTVSMRVRRLVAGTAATGLLAGGAALGMSTTANAAPAPSSVTSVVTGDHHDRHDKCKWQKGHWEKKWVKGHWEKKQVHHKTWHKGHHDKHGTWHQGSWEHHYTYKWIHVPGHWDHHWVKGHWDCKHH
ncbi:hypothetical protein NFX46_22520 [Streptomyces phaeoluteigriseus]|uniref:BcpO-related WXXGXW repeat protein n=1 Tax=Streptomyces phaeoluteigriseus TaxID=114686 RepID=A0ABY4ZBA0_9ACTN|nr:hypothetical protein [Streptomyces phaeoluteigriseus]USQ86230.1 hypothetical protein NFX46_22520 [Streptomyces phaeoluteigriseus]